MVCIPSEGTHDTLSQCGSPQTPIILSPIIEQKT